MSRLNLLNWDQVVKGEDVKFYTTRPMTWGDKELEVGSILPETNLLTLRNLYELQYISTEAPVREKPTKRSTKQAQTEAKKSADVHEFDLHDPDEDPHPEHVNAPLHNFSVRPSNKKDR